MLEYGQYQVSANIVMTKSTSYKVIILNSFLRNCDDKFIHGKRMEITFDDICIALRLKCHTRLTHVYLGIISTFTPLQTDKMIYQKGDHALRCMLHFFSPIHQIGFSTRAEIIGLVSQTFLPLRERAVN